jgi:hypothetical protein
VTASGTGAAPSGSSGASKVSSSGPSKLKIKDPRIGGGAPAASSSPVTTPVVGSGVDLARRVDFGSNSSVWEVRTQITLHVCRLSFLTTPVHCYKGTARYQAAKNLIDTTTN